MLESREMYLETIYVLSRKSPTVRRIDVGEYMGYSKPSVSRAMDVLKNEGLVRDGDGGNLILTQAGEELARQIYERHTVLSEVFRALGVDEQTAQDDACRVEHYLSEQTFEKIKQHLMKYKKNIE